MKPFNAWFSGFSSSTSRLIAVGSLLTSVATAFIFLSIFEVVSKRYGVSMTTFTYFVSILGLMFIAFNLVFITRAVQQTLELELAKKLFVSLASHQLRTPSTAVKNTLSIMLEGYSGSFTPEQRNYLTLAYESNERQLQIVESLIYAAQLETSQLQLEYSRVHVANVVRDVAERFRATLHQRSQTLELDLKDGATVEADAVCLRVVVENLLSNASKYTPTGGHIHMNLTHDDGSVMLEVKDTGVGIAEDDLESLFKSFSRLKNPLSTQVGGTGLGLYITKRMVELHGGRITVVSKLDKGSVFTLRLPKRLPGAAL